MNFSDLSNPYENNEPKCRHGVNGGNRGGCSECPGGINYTRRKEVINAQEAKELFVQPPYTEEEIEAKIRERAERQTFTVFDKLRMQGNLLDVLRTSGYQVSDNGDTFLVSWD